MKNVLIVSGNSDYQRLFVDLGFAITYDVSKADLVCFTGGADVSPELYGDKRHQATHSDMMRDKKEQAIFQEALSEGIPMVGICRGGQFLNVMNGGRMYQDVSKHALSTGHSITDLITGEVVYVSSTHHQMFMPSPEALVVATSTLGGFREWYDGEVLKRDISDQDYEVVYYGNTECLCFQPHPEFNRAEYVGMRKYFQNCLKTYLKI